MEGETYLGDAVYASFDGFNIWLRCAAPTCRIALEPSVFHALVTYEQRLRIPVRNEGAES